MAGIPALTIDDTFVDGMACPICAAMELSVSHIANFPDYVTCGQCASAFVVEDTGERVMYGRIPPEYPRAVEFALKQWVWLEAVSRRAAEDRPEAPSPVSLPSPLEAPAQEAPAVEEEEADPDWLGGRLRSTEGWSAGVPIPTEPETLRPPSPHVVLSRDTEPLPDWLGSGRGTPVEPPPLVVPPPAPTPARVLPAVQASNEAAAVGEPAVGQRTRVTLGGDRVRFPINACAHCLRMPASARWPVVGSLPRPATLGGRRPATFRIPLCPSCRRRAAARSSEQTSSRLQAHLISALVGLAVVVGALALNLVSFDGNPLGSLALLGGLAVLAYAIPAVALVGRAGRAPLPPDTLFVRTTLLVRGSPLSPETIFAWRNAGYAETFFQANSSAAVGGPAPTDEDADIV
jgi:hypothetical protein